MTNPDNIVRVRARNGGRASIYEANGWCQPYSQGIVEGNGVLQNTSADMNVLVGGSSAKPDVLIAENPAGYKIALDLVGQQAIAITAPASNSRISAIVAYTDDLSLVTTEDTVTGSPASCGLIVVNGTASVAPSEPTDSQIRTAITSDGATGSQAAYCVIATVLVANDTTTITNSLITNKQSGIGANNIDFQTMKRWLPDYSNATSILASNKASYTMESDGFVNVGLYRYNPPESTDVTIAVAINGVTVGYVGSGAVAANGAKAGTYTGMFPVLAGDIVTVNFSPDTAALSRIYFIPGKWA